MPRRLPDETIPALKASLNGDGMLVDSDFIRHPKMGRVILHRVVEAGWLEKVTGGGWDGTVYRLTGAGRTAIYGGER